MNESDYRPGLVGREAELASLRGEVESVRDGSGRFVLLAGESGSGKTRLCEAVLEECDFDTLVGRSRPGVNPPYAPLAAIVRTALRANPAAVSESLTAYLAMLLPELGPAPAEIQQDTLVEAIAGVLVPTGDRPRAVLLDDLHWADNATLEVLPILADRLADQRVLLLATYRDDELTRNHPMRRMKYELRRARRLYEMVLGPLSRGETATLIAELIQDKPSVQLVGEIYDRTQGIPLFIEELVGALRGAEQLHRTEKGIHLVSGEQVPLPETIRDAVVLALDDLSSEARSRLELAAVAGPEVDLALIADLEGESGLDELFERGVLREERAGRAVFRHHLICEAIQHEIPWARRRSLHRSVAGYLTKCGAPPEQVADHWREADEPIKAREALIESADRSCRIHAYRDAAQSAHQALELWPAGEEEARRLATLERFASCAQMGGRLDDAVRAWRELLDSPGVKSDARRRAHGLRSLATVYGLQGAWEHSIESRMEAAEIFEAEKLHGDAAVEWLTTAGRLCAALQLKRSLGLVQRAAKLAHEAKRYDTYVRARALEAYVLAQLGEPNDGRRTAEEALSFALEHNLTEAAAEAYRRLAGSYELASDYRTARDAFSTAMSFCQQNELGVQTELCLGCMGWILFRLGEWKRSFDVCHEVAASEHAPTDSKAAANVVNGLLHAHRGETKQARALLERSLQLARKAGATILELPAYWGLALVADYEGDTAAAERHYDEFIRCWEKTEDRHDAIPALVTGVTFFTAHDLHEQAGNCVRFLGEAAEVTGNPECLAALAYGVGITTMASGDTAEAERQLKLALELLQKLDLPFELALVLQAVGETAAAAGDRERAGESMHKGYRILKKLGARSASSRVAYRMRELGLRAEEGRGSTSGGREERGGLTRRQLEVARLMAEGFTNKEIAEKLFLSPRTIDMHVSNILARLDCRTRAEAARKTADLDLFD